MNRKSNLSALLTPSLLALALVATGCGKDPAASGNVTLKSSAFGSATPVVKTSPWDFLIPRAFAANPPVLGITQFSFCVTQAKLEAEDGALIKPEGDSDGLLEISLGLINTGDGSVAATWGDVNLPVGTPLKRVKIEVHKDAEKCGGATYSAKINDQSISKDLEFSFAFAAGTVVEDGKAINFDLAPIVAAFKSVLDAGQFTDELVGNFLEGIEGDASEED